MKTVIVTRHEGLVEWLRMQGISGNVIAQATPKDVAGNIVIGALPLHLASLAQEVISIDLPGLTPEQRGKDLTPAEMDAAGAKMSRYKVEAVQDEVIGRFSFCGMRVELVENGDRVVAHARINPGRNTHEAAHYSRDVESIAGLIEFLRFVDSE